MLLLDLVIWSLFVLFLQYDEILGKGAFKTVYVSTTYIFFSFLFLDFMGSGVELYFHA